MVQLTGGGHCGTIRYAIDGEPMAVSHCHCTDCRRATGAPFITWITLPRAAYALTKGTPTVYTSTPTVERRFCGTCGATLSYSSTAHTEEVDISAATLDDPEAVSPDDHLWSGAMLSWIRMDDGLPRLDAAHWQHGYPKRT